MKHFKVVVEQHEDGFVAYPVGLNGVVVGQGNTEAEAMADVRSAIQFHQTLLSLINSYSIRRRCARQLSWRITPARVSVKKLLCSSAHEN